MRGIPSALWVDPRWWRFSAETIHQHGDYLLAFVDGEVWVGAFEIAGAKPDEQADGKYVFDLKPASHFQWALGRKLPLQAGRNPARVLTGHALWESFDSDPR